MSDGCCFYSLQTQETAIFTGFTDRWVVHGPKSLTPFFFCCRSIEVVRQPYCQQNEYILVKNSYAPEKTRYEYGPQLVQLNSAWESFDGQPQLMRVLDQDDYVVVRDLQGKLRVETGPKVFQFAEYGETIVRQGQSVQVPLNHYIEVYDANDTTQPVKHIRGPDKFYPGEFQTVTKNEMTGKFFYPCEEVTANSALHLQKCDGSVVLIDTPSFVMPEVGEKILERVERTVLLQTDFCILKTPSGHTHIKNGRVPEHRSFFVEPFNEFVTFTNEREEEKILSTIPKFLEHRFIVLTSDNVNLNLDTRINYQVVNVDQFTENAINFYEYIRSHVQNVLLDKFAQSQLREFMTKFTSIAQETIPDCSAYFQDFGIEIRDIQILDYRCPNPDTQKLLSEDIHLNVNKQNELRARQNDVAIQEESNKVMMKQKDMEVEVDMKDNEVAYAKKQLEVDIRIKEMDIEIQEEIKRRELLDVKRENDLVEAEFEGRAKGHEIAEFLKGIDPSLTSTQKLRVWNRRLDLEQAIQLYDKVPALTLYPPESDMKVYQMRGDQNGMGSKVVKDGVMSVVGAYSNFVEDNKPRLPE